jgi:Holliday junction resolvase RusA-like endonuclease
MSKGKIVYQASIPINPITKKNSQEIRINQKTGKRFPAQNKRYEQYEKDARYFLKALKEPIDFPVNLKCVFYRATRHRVDLSNLIEAIQDILVKYGILRDDNHNIVKSLDGCKAFVGSSSPRTEIEITEV